MAHLATVITVGKTLGEFENWLEGHGSYLFLQRMGIMAPLVGLLITVVGFFFLQPPTADGDLKEILYALTPLVLGVGTGASLALTNQLLLHFGERTLNRILRSGGGLARGARRASS